VDRQRYDFACTIKQTLSRAVVGQTLWKHTSGIEKDVRSLLLDCTAEIKVCLVRADARTKARLGATIDEFRSSGRFDDQMFRLLCLDVPQFDADDEVQRRTVRRVLRDQITDHLLFRIVFGGLTSRDVGFLLHVTNTNSHDLAFNLRLLHYIRSGRFISFRSTASDLGTNSSKVRERRHILFGAGFVEPKRGDLVVTESGETFLRMLDRLGAEVRAGALSPEILYLFDKIGCALTDVLRLPTSHSPESLRPMHLLAAALYANDFNESWRLEPNFDRLVVVAQIAGQWDIDRLES
jgi:hypothetical protein